MPRCGATFDEKQRPPLDKGDFRGVLGGNPTNPRLDLCLCSQTIFKRATHAAAPVRMKTSYSYCPRFFLGTTGRTRGRVRVRRRGRFQRRQPQRGMKTPKKNSS
jgi:hypothetical protein